MEKVETNNGEVVKVYPDIYAEHVISELKADGIVHFNGSVVWDYVDSDNKFFRSSPESDEVLSRANYNKIVCKIVKENWGN